MQEHFHNNQGEKLKIVINGVDDTFTLPFLLIKKEDAIQTMFPVQKKNMVKRLKVKEGKRKWQNTWIWPRHSNNYGI